MYSATKKRKKKAAVMIENVYLSTARSFSGRLRHTLRLVNYCDLRSNCAESTFIAMIANRIGLQILKPYWLLKAHFEAPLRMRVLDLVTSSVFPIYICHG